MSDKTPDISQIKQYLKDVGVYEDSMAVDEMMNIYKAFESSVNTADEENKQRMIIKDAEKNVKEMENLQLTKKQTEDLVEEDSQSEKSTEAEPKKEKPFTPKSWVSKVKTFESKKEEEEPDDVFAGLNAYNCPRLTENPLPLAKLNPKYEEPFYCKIAKMNISLDEKVKLVAKYHDDLLKNYDAMQRRQINFPSSDQRTSRSSRINGSSTPETSEEPQIYISRTGRLTKRKVYAESSTNSEEVTKKSKAERKQPLQITKSIRKRANENSQSEDNPKKSKPLTTSRVPPSRSEMLFDNLKSEEATRSKKEQDLDRFRETLKFASDDEDFEKKDATPQKAPHNPFLKKRNVVDVSSTNNSDIVRKDEESAGEDNLSSSQESLIILPRKRRTINSTVKCPICSKDFSQDEITFHASSCTASDPLPTGTGDTMVLCSVCELFYCTSQRSRHLENCIGVVKEKNV